MRVLITGGAGFIGSHLADRLLRSGASVRLLDTLDPQVHGDARPAYLSSEAELRLGDVQDPDAVADAMDGVDVVVHLAAAVGVGQSMYQIVRYASVNAVGAAVVLEAAVARRHDIEKLVVASSMSIYGEGAYRCPNERLDVAPPPRTAEQLRARRWELLCASCEATLEPVPTPESKPLAPTSVYAVTKRDQEDMFLSVGPAYGIPTTALRFFNVYGPHQSVSNPYTGVAAIFASRLRNRASPIIFEDGLQTRDFVHVSDVAAAVEMAMVPGRADGLAVNVGTGRPTTVVAVAEAVARGLGVDVAPTVHGTARAGDIRHCIADTSVARSALRYEAAVRFDDGMADLVRWLETQAAVDKAAEAHAALVERGLVT